MQSMPLLFSYGTLQDVEVQHSTFGRTLRGEPDALPGFQPALVKIEGSVAATVPGRTHHANVIPVKDNAAHVPGTVFEVTEEELAAADSFEAPAKYARIAVTLASGKEAWVYLFTPLAGQS